MRVAQPGLSSSLDVLTCRGAAGRGRLTVQPKQVSHVRSSTAKKRIRKSFGRIPEVTEMPNLIEVQRQSYDTFLQMHMPRRERELVGLRGGVPLGLPDRDFADRAALDFVKYELEEPKYDVEECHQRGMTYAAPLRVTLRLIVWDVDEETGSRASATSRSRMSTWATCRS